MVTINISGKVLSIIVIILLISGMSLFSYHTFFKKTGYTSYDGFSSYEEMMQAHHGGGSSGSSMAGHHGGSGGMSGSCGGVAIESGEMSEYGVSYDQSGYEELLTYNSIKLSSEENKKIIGLNVLIDCCGFSKIQAANNCECEHHLALYGLAKLLASKGYDKQYIQSEIDKWKDIFNMSNIGGCG